MSGLLRRLAQQAVTPEAAAVHPLQQLPYNTPQDVDLATASAPQRRPPAPLTPSLAPQAEESAAAATPSLVTTSPRTASTPTTGPTSSPGPESGEPQPVLEPQPAAATKATITTMAEQPTAPHEPGVASAAPVTAHNRPVPIITEGQRPVGNITAADTTLSASEGLLSAREPQGRAATASPTPQPADPSAPLPTSPTTVPTDLVLPDPLLAPTPHGAPHGAPHDEPVTSAEPTGLRLAKTEPEPTEVHVHIGRIEVTAVAETTPAPKRSRPRREPMSLDEYLAQRQRERR